MNKNALYRMKSHHLHALVYMQSLPSHANADPTQAIQFPISRHLLNPSLSIYVHICLFCNALPALFFPPTLIITHENNTRGGDAEELSHQSIPFTQGEKGGNASETFSRLPSTTNTNQSDSVLSFDSAEALASTISALFLVFSRILILAEFFICQFIR